MNFNLCFKFFFCAPVAVHSRGFEDSSQRLAFSVCREGPGWGLGPSALVSAALPWGHLTP